MVWKKDGDEIPIPSKIPEMDPDTAAGYIVSPVTVFPDLVRNELDNRAVKTYDTCVVKGDGGSSGRELLKGISNRAYGLSWYFSTAGA